MANNTETSTTTNLLATFQTQDFQDLWAVASEYDKKKFIDDAMAQMKRKYDLLLVASRLSNDGRYEAAAALVKYVSELPA